MPDVHLYCSRSISLPFYSSEAYHDLLVGTPSKPEEKPLGGWWLFSKPSSSIRKTVLDPEIPALPGWQESGWPLIPECDAQPLGIRTGKNTSMGSTLLDGNPPWTSWWCASQSPTPVGDNFACLRRPPEYASEPLPPTSVQPLRNRRTSTPATLSVMTHIWWNLLGSSCSSFKNYLFVQEIVSRLSIKSSFVHNFPN